MNKQELIEKIEARHVCDLAVSDSFKNGFNTMKGIAVDLAKELDEPAKPLETLIRMKDGYTVKQEPKWIVKTSEGYWVNSITSNLHNSKVIDFSDNKRPSLIFLDKKTAEAVATLIEGSVEEV